MLQIHRFEMDFPSPLERLPAARSLNQNSPHGLGGGRKKMAAAFKAYSFALHQTQPRFMNQSRRLQRLPRRLSAHPVSSELPQFVVNQRKQFRSSPGIPSLDRVENTRRVA